MENGLVLFVPVILLCTFFFLTLIALGRDAATSAFQSINGWEKLVAARKGMDRGDVPQYLVDVANSADALNPVSSRYADQSPRRFVGNQRLFPDVMRLHGDPTLQLGRNFAIMAWVKQLEVVRSANLISKVRTDNDGNEQVCWQLKVGPLSFEHRTFMDPIRRAWAQEEGLANTVGKDSYTMTGRSTELDTQADQWHLIAMSWTYNVEEQASTFLFGVDGPTLVRDAHYANNYPVIDCVDGQLLIGDTDMWIADMIWLPWALQETDFDKMFKGDLSRDLGLLAEENLELAGIWRASNIDKHAKRQEELRNRDHNMMSWIHMLLDDQMEDEPPLGFDEKDHGCVHGEPCEVRVHPLGVWYKDLVGLEDSRLVIVPAKGSCSSNVSLVISSPPVYSDLPVQSNSYLDRYRLNTSELAAGKYQMCWYHDEKGHFVGTLVMDPGPLQYIEVVGDAAVTLRRGDASRRNLSAVVPYTQAYTVTAWVQYETGLTSNPLLFSLAVVGQPDPLAGLSFRREETGLDLAGIVADAQEDVPALSAASCSADFNRQMRHIAFVYSSEKARILIFVDGNLCYAYRAQSPDMKHGKPMVLKFGTEIDSPTALEGTLKQLRWYGTALSPQEINVLAGDYKHKTCWSTKALTDDVFWRDGSGRSCWDIWEGAARGLAVVCTPEAKEACPLACPNVPKCYARPVAAETTHIFPRAVNDRIRVCLRHGHHAKDEANNCRNATQDTKKLLGNQTKGSVCDLFQNWASASESCPLTPNATDALSRFGTVRGGDMTILYWGDTLQVLCNLFDPTQFKLMISKDTSTFYDGDEAVGLATSMGPGFNALSVSPYQNEIIHVRNGGFQKSKFYPIEDCDVQAILMNKVTNLRIVDEFLPLGELLSLYYQETREYRLGKMITSPVADQTQFLPAKATFKPYTKAFMSYTVPVVWQSLEDGSDNVCKGIISGTVKSLLQRRTESAMCQGGCKTVDLGICGKTSEQDRSTAQMELSWRGEPGLAWSLPVLMHPVIKVGENLLPPSRLLSLKSRKLDLLMVFFSPSREVFTFANVHFDLRKAQVTGHIRLLSRAEPLESLQIVAPLTLVPAVAVSLCVIHRVIKFYKYPSKGLDELRNAGEIVGHSEELHEYFYVRGPVSAEPLSSPLILLFLGSLATAIYSVFIAWSGHADGQQMKTIAEALLGDQSLTKRLQSIDELHTLLQRENWAHIIGMLIGCVLAVMANLLLCFHVRTAVVVRTLVRSFSPIMHFMVIFLITFVALGLTAAVVLGVENSGFSTIGSMLKTQIDFLLGDRPTEAEGSITLHLVYQGAFLLFMTLVMFNVFLAIIMESYATETQQVQDIRIENSLMRDLWQLVKQAVKLRWSRGKRLCFAKVLMELPEDQTCFSSCEELLEMLPQNVNVRMDGQGCTVEDDWGHEFYFSKAELGRFCDVYLSCDAVRMEAVESEGAEPSRPKVSFFMHHTRSSASHKDARHRHSHALRGSSWSRKSRQADNEFGDVIENDATTTV